VVLPFFGGQILRTGHNWMVGAGALIALSILAAWAMGQGDLTRPAVLSSLVAGGLLGVAIDFGPVLRDVRELFGRKKPPDNSPP
jgi:hypothetical protein